MTGSAPHELVAQRLRNRTIQYLSWVRDADEHLDYQSKVPYVNVPSEAINQWDDFMGEAGLNRLESWLYSDEEKVALRAFHEVWDTASKSYPIDVPLAEGLKHPSTRNLMMAAEAAYRVMMKRGLFSDEDLERT